MTKKPSQQNAFEKVFCHALSQECRFVNDMLHIWERE